MGPQERITSPIEDFPVGDLAGPDHAVNSLTIRSFDELAHQPEFKACAVRVTKV